MIAVPTLKSRPNSPATPHQHADIKSHRQMFAFAAPPWCCVACRMTVSGVLTGRTKEEEYERKVIPKCSCMLRLWRRRWRCHYSGLRQKVGFTSMRPVLILSSSSLLDSLNLALTELPDNVALSDGKYQTEQHLVTLVHHPDDSIPQPSTLSKHLNRCLIPSSTHTGARLSLVPVKSDSNLF